jgi:putative oxidoreductase
MHDVNGLGGPADLGLFVARCLLSLIFAASAYDKFTAPSAEIEMIKTLYLPFPRLLEYGAGVFEAICIIALVSGIYARSAAAMLAMFLLIITVLLVRFWSETGEKRAIDRNTFFSNMSIVGGCLCIVIVGPGGIALGP